MYIFDQTKAPKTTTLGIGLFNVPRPLLQVCRRVGASAHRHHPWHRPVQCPTPTLASVPSRGYWCSTSLLFCIVHCILLQFNSFEPVLNFNVINRCLNLVYLDATTQLLSSFTHKYIYIYKISRIYSTFCHSNTLIYLHVTHQHIVIIS